MGWPASRKPWSAVTTIRPLSSIDAASLSSSRSSSATGGGHSAVLLKDGKVLVAGGGGTFLDGLVDTLDSAEVYDPKKDRWSSAESMSQWRFHTTTLMSDGSVVVAGGQVLREGDGLFAEKCGVRTTCALVLASTEVYDPATDTWLSRDLTRPGER
ncbi:MAG: kelch repeat-containing protein [Chloroflexi bacterium]|nr:kelch repeat-containing protein [Chloroflexota bacterium]